MPQPLCREIGGLYQKITEEKDGFDTLFVLAKELGFKDKELNRNALAQRKAIETAMRDCREKLAPFKIVDFYGQQIHQYEAVALRKLAQEVSARVAAYSVDYIPELAYAATAESFLRKSFENKWIQVDNSHNVEYLDLENLPLGKIPGSLNELDKIRILTLRNFGLAGINNIDALTRLQFLSLSGNQKISSLSGTENLLDLQFLFLNSTSISDTKGLARFKKLRHLDLKWTPVSDIKGLLGLDKIDTLLLRQTKISDLSDFENLPALRKLDVQVCPIDPQANAAQIARLKAKLGGRFEI